MTYTAHDFSSLLGLPGFSDNALTTHFKLYEGYVTNTNKLLEQLGNTPAGTPEFNELKRRFGWEFNGMRVHEFYFASLSKEPTALDPTSVLAQKIDQSFGSFEKWQEDFKATAMTRGIGWTILYLDQNQDRLINVWVNEHDTGHLAGCTPILPIDIFEHAFMLDYGTNRADYITAFLAAVDWSVVSQRISG